MGTLRSGSLSAGKVPDVTRTLLETVYYSFNSSRAAWRENPRLVADSEPYWEHARRPLK